MRTYVCEYCGYGFKTTDYKRRYYCSVSCAKQADGIQWLIKTCEVCNEEFVSTRRHQRFCSRSCVSAYSHTTPGGIARHKRHSEYMGQRYKRGAKQWNKGLTKYSDERIAKNIEAAVRTRKAKDNYRNSGFFLFDHIPPQNKFEKWVEKTHPALRFVGDGSFWITLPNGRNKNPDFLIEPFSETKTVLEAADISYWHTQQEMEEVRRLYEEKGWTCILVYYQDYIDDPIRTADTLISNIEEVVHAKVC